jgi:hypothetical protein
MPSNADAVPCTFTHFIVSISQSALVAMGEVQGPSGVNKDLQLAGYNLDVLRLLQAKTKGNLDDDEQRLLDALVKEVGDRFSDRSKN